MVRHGIKLAEVQASLDDTRSDPLPPPPYQEAAESAPGVTQNASDDFDEFDEDPFDDEFAPITIRLDTSIVVDGTNNTVMLPISGGALGSRVCPASAKKQAVRSDLVPQEFQPYRQQRSAQLVLSIITALQQSGVLETNESSRKRPIEININAGLCVRGEHNVVCSGLLKRVDGKPSSPEATQVAGRKRSLSTEPDVTIQSSKKRNLSEA